MPPRVALHSSLVHGRSGAAAALAARALLLGCPRSTHQCARRPMPVVIIRFSSDSVTTTPSLSAMSSSSLSILDHARDRIDHLPACDPPHPRRTIDLKSSLCEPPQVPSRSFRCRRAPSTDRAMVHRCIVPSGRSAAAMRFSSRLPQATCFHCVAPSSRRPLVHGPRHRLLWPLLQLH